MRKLFLILCVVAFSATSAFAQEEVAKKSSFAGFETNGFWDNWEISLSGGVNTAIASGNNIGARKDRIGGLEVAFSLTKWFHPVVGVRGQLQGGYFKNVEPWGAKEKWPYVFAHVDAMVNFSNWVGGYREDRVYYAVPFVGGGWICSNFARQGKNNAETDQEFAFDFGLLNKFRVCRQLDIDLELKGFLTKADLSSTEMHGRFMTALSASIGLTYRFGQRNFTRGYVGPSPEEVRAYQDANRQLKSDLENAGAENERLAAENAELKDALLKAQKAAEEQPEEVEADKRSNMVVLFNCGSATLTQREKTRLDIVAEVIKDGDQDIVYVLESHADHQTGSAKRNATLSEMRSEAVRNYLVKKGVNPDMLKVRNMGGDENPFKTQEANRSVVVLIE